MLKIYEIQEKRSRLLDTGKAIAAKAETEKRALNTGEAAEIDRLATEIEALNADERRARIFEDAERRAAAEPIADRDMARDLRSYSLAKAVQEASAGRLSGVEAEFHQELSKGREVRGVMVPSAILLESRAQTVGTAAAGGYTVATDLAAVADRINRPALKVEAMGATVMRGLSGFVDLPNLTTSGSVAWVAEDGAATRSTTSFGKVSMAPKTVTGEYQLSRRLLLQSATAIEDLLRRDLGLLLATALDAAAINGSGASNQPRGLLNTAGIETVTASAFFGDTISDLIAALELDDITGTRAILTNPTVMNTARKLKDGDGLKIPTADLFHNERVEVSSQVPKALGAGTDKSAVICGIWSEMVVGYWSAVDILANPYHADVASKGGVLLHAFLDADVVLRHPEAFSYALV